jgi:VWFA-related protein
MTISATLNAQLPSASSPTNSTAPQQTPADAGSTYTITTTVRRVVLDVVVTDAKGNPAPGLKSTDFKVFEDGVEQHVRSFDVHTANTFGPQQQDVALNLPSGVYTNFTQASPDKPVTVLLYDMLNTPQTALPYAHQALVKFIKQQKGSTQIAIFVLTDRLHMLQGFTVSETRLMEAIDSKGAKSQISHLNVADTSATEGRSTIAADQAASQSPQQAAASAANPSVGADAILAQLSDVEAQEDAYLLRQRLELTVDAFEDIARFVGTLPGRKNLIWLSGSFPSSLLPDSTPQSSGTQNEFGNTLFLEADIRKAQALLKESRVAVYPVDVRGLQVSPRFSAATNHATPPSQAGDFIAQQAAEHSTMDDIAESTGGHAFYNTNGLQQAMDTATRQGSEYYSLTYAPTDTKDDGGQRHIRVVLDNPNYQLSYRRSYLADDATHPHNLQPLIMDMDMQHGAPSMSELLFEANTTPIGPVVPALAPEMLNLKDFLSKARGRRVRDSGSTVNVQHYGVNMVILGRQLTMPLGSDGLYATDMHIGLAAYMRDGELLAGVEVNIKNNIPEEQYRKIREQGYHAAMTFVVPVDAQSLRIAVRDEIGNRIGTLEVPLPSAPTKMAYSVQTKSH